MPVSQAPASMATDTINSNRSSAAGATSNLYDQEEPLCHISLNPSKSETIVLLHGVLSCHLEWIFIIPQLSDYHLLLVDLPGHSGSANLATDAKNIAIPVMADRVASLIRRFAHARSLSDDSEGRTAGAGERNGVAHIVGLSMGGFVTLDLARRHPSLCLSAFATGAAPFEGTFAFMAKYPTIVYSVMWTFNHLPEAFYWWVVGRVGMRRVDELREEQKKNLRWEVIRDVYTSILNDCSGEKGWDLIREQDQVRMLNVAGGLQDDLKSSAKIRDIWKETGVMERLGSRVVVVRKAVHAWNLHKPDIFAEGILKWIRGEGLPEEFEDL